MKTREALDCILYPDNIVRKAIIEAHNMDFDEYCKVFGLEKEFTRGAWELQQNDFGRWFCYLDSGQAEIFMRYVMEERK